jgi:hypothetical protein
MPPTGKYGKRTLNTWRVMGIYEDKNKLYIKMFCKKLQAQLQTCRLLKYYFSRFGFLLYLGAIRNSK